MFDNLLSILKEKFDDLTFLFLKYSFDRLKNLFMTSNCLFHLFSCPRSDYAKNNCICCSRLYIDASIRLLNLEKLENFFLDYVSNNLKIFLKEKSYNKIKLNLFFDSIEQYNAINSDKKRRLNTYVVNNFFELITLFFETQLECLVIFFTI